MIRLIVPCEICLRPLTDREILHSSGRPVTLCDDCRLRKFYEFRRRPVHRLYVRFTSWLMLVGLAIVAATVLTVIGEFLR